MKNKLTRYVVGVLILGLVLLAVSCGGTTSAPTEKPVTEEPAVEESAAAGGSATMLHSLEGRDDCLMCHGESAAKPFPADHAGRANDTCLECHK
ncbi:hypothetical protein ACFLUY_01120 [Chloroflexota bacterium]